MTNIKSTPKSRMFFAIVLLSITSAVIWLLPNQEISDYESYLSDHPYNQKHETMVRYEDIPKRDRPDLAWEQDFLATMDPKLKRPTPERLTKTRAEVKEYFDSNKNARTGTAEFPWVERGPNNVGGRTRAIMWDPNDTNGKKVWAGGVTGGLWYTSDIYNANTTWTKVDDFWDNISIVCIAYDPNSTTTFYVGTGEGFGAGASRGAGIWKTTDGGQSWSQLSASSEFYYVNDIIVRNESGTSVVYAGVRGNFYNGEWHSLNNTGLQRSTNGGTSFTQVLPEVSGSTYAAADIELGADNRIWVGSQANPFGDGGGAILYSDNGTTWTLATTRSNASRVELASAPSNKDVVYGLIEGSNVVSEIIKSTDQGATWTNVSEPNDADDGIPASDFTRGQAWYDLIMTVDPNDANTVLVGGIDLFKSTDAGSTWTQISHWYGGFGFPNVHADQHSMAFKPGSSTDIIFGNDGGMYVSSDMTSNTPSFTNRNNNYNVTQFYATAIHPDAGKDYFLAGSQDNGTQRFRSAGVNATTEAYGGDGAYCFIDQKDGDIQIVSYVYNVYALSTNGGDSFVDFVDDQESGSFINPADYDDNLGILYSGASSGSIGRFLNIKTGSPTRSDLSIDLGSDATHFSVSPYTTASTTLYVGTQFGSLFKITNANGSATSTDISGTSFPDGSISSIELGASENELLVTFSNYGVTSVWYTSNGGTSWTSKEGNLPDMPIRWAMFNPNNRTEAILATEMGIWRTENIDTSNPSWTSSNIGLANVRVDMLQRRDSDNEVIAATFGRGLYSSSGFSGETTTGINSKFSAASTTIDIGGSVSFSDNSTGDPVSWSWTFEGGTPNTSTDQNPTVTYASSGSYDVTLIVTDAQNETSTKTLENYITVSAPSLANLAFYNPGNDWVNSIVVSNKEDDFTNTAQLTVSDDLFISYAMVNNGEASIETALKANIKIDGNSAASSNWNFSLTNSFANGFYITWENVNLGSLSAGEHTIEIILDSEGTLTESDETDNTASYTFAIQESCDGENTLTEVSGSIEDGSGASEYYNFRDCQWTISPDNASSITLSFSEFDLEENFDFLIVYAGSDLNTALHTLSGTTLPEDITIDESEVILSFTSDSDVTEGGWKLSYTSTQVQSDLETEDVVAVISNSNLMVDALIKNIGSANITENFQVKFYLSSDDTFSSTDMLLASETVAGLDASDEKTIQVEVDISNIEPGDYFVHVLADSDEAISEEDETNNEKSASFNIAETSIILSSSLAESLKIYPNPVGDVLNIDGGSASIFTLTDLSGKVLIEGILDGSRSLDMSPYKSGLYLISITSGKEVIIKKIRKIR